MNLQTFGGHGTGVGGIAGGVVVGGPVVVVTSEVVVVDFPVVVVTRPVVVVAAVVVGSVVDGAVLDGTEDDGGTDEDGTGSHAPSAGMVTMTEAARTRRRFMTRHDTWRHQVRSRQWVKLWITSCGARTAVWTGSRPSASTRRNAATKCWPRTPTSCFPRTRWTLSRQQQHWPLLPSSDARGAGVATADVWPELRVGSQVQRVQRVPRDGRAEAPRVQPRGFSHLLNGRSQRCESWCE